MERELKFRAWNNIHNRMEKVTTLSLYEAKPKHLWQADDKHNRYDDFPIMQFTGLHDKNGKEIYDKDYYKIDEIVWFIYWGENTQDGGRTQGWCMKPIDSEKSYPLDFKQKKGVVIGNIYETAELLNNQPL